MPFRKTPVFSVDVRSASGSPIRRAIDLAKLLCFLPIRARASINEFPEFHPEKFGKMGKRFIKRQSREPDDAVRLDRIADARNAFFEHTEEILTDPSNQECGE